MNIELRKKLIIYKQKYIKQKSNKLINKFESFINIDIFIDIKKNLNFDYSIYNNHFNPLIPLYKQKKQNLDIYTDYSILKTKLLIFDIVVSFYILFKYLDLKLYINDNTLLVSHNYGILELLKFYNFNNVDHFFIKKFDKTNYILHIEKLKDLYNYNDNKYGVKLKKNYSLMIFDLAFTFINKEDTNDNTTEFSKLIKKKEHSNLFLLEYLYEYLDNLDIDGNIIIFISLYFMEETLLLLEDIFNCFTKIKLYRFGYNIGFFPYIYCYKYKGKQKKQTKLSKNFYDFIKGVYHSMVKLATNYINYNTKINKLIADNPNSKELKEIADTNYNIAEQTAKFIGLETYNYRDNLYYELSNYMQQFYILDQTINIKFNINQTIININDIIKINNNIIINDIQLINNKLIKLINQQLFRPKTLLANIESQIINNYSSINEVLTKNNKNKKTKITDKWILIYELLNIINYVKLEQNLIINVLLISVDNEWLSPLAYYMKKNMQNYKLNHKIAKPVIHKQTNIKLSDDNIDWIIIDYNIDQDTKLIYSNILFILYNLKFGSNCIITLTTPIVDKIIIDMIYLMYLSFDNLLFTKPIYKQSNNIFYIVGLKYHKQIINFDKLLELLNNKDISNQSIIENDYIHDFKFQYINVYNILIKNQSNIIDTKLFFTDFWQNIPDSIKSEIKSAINTKNINYIEKFFNQFE